jgi:hypothetical protein
LKKSNLSYSIIGAAIAVVAIALMIANTTPHIVYAQIATPPADIEIIEGEQILDPIRQLLYSYKIVDYTLAANGTAQYTLGASPNSTSKIIIITEHPYTPENGYTFDNATGLIKTPEGGLLVISTARGR